jgi:putative nucleotidyltransferase with HDIG domain
MRTGPGLVDDAQALAQTLLPPLGRRWRHVQAVAARAEALRAAVAISEQDLLVAAAWLHDIGYALELADTGFHPLDGARFLEREGFPISLVRLVAHHSCARYEASERGLDQELAVYPFEGGPVMDALVFADMTTGPDGEGLTFEQRIDEILVRYTADSPVHRAITRARTELLRAVTKTLHRVEESGGPAVSS